MKHMIYISFFILSISCLCYSDIRIYDSSGSVTKGAPVVGGTANRVIYTDANTKVGDNTNFTFNGTTFSVLGVTVRDGAFHAKSYTEAELKVSTPSVKGDVFYDSTNDEYVKSTGTTTCLDWSQIHDKTAAPVGW